MKKLATAPFAMRRTAFFCSSFAFSWELAALALGQICSPNCAAPLPLSPCPGECTWHVRQGRETTVGCPFQGFLRMTSKKVLCVPRFGAGSVGGRFRHGRMWHNDRNEKGLGTGKQGTQRRCRVVSREAGEKRHQKRSWKGQEEERYGQKCGGRRRGQQKGSQEGLRSNPRREEDNKCGMIRIFVHIPRHRTLRQSLAVVASKERTLDTWLHWKRVG